MNLQFICFSNAQILSRYEKTRIIFKDTFSLEYHWTTKYLYFDILCTYLFPAMTLRSTQPFILSRSINEYQHAGVSGLN